MKIEIIRDLLSVKNRPERPDRPDRQEQIDQIRQEQIYQIRQEQIDQIGTDRSDRNRQIRSDRNRQIRQEQIDQIRQQKIAQIAKIAVLHIHPVDDIFSSILENDSVYYIWSWRTPLLISAYFVLTMMSVKILTCLLNLSTRLLWPQLSERGRTGHFP